MTLNRNHSKWACFQTLENNVASCTPASCCGYFSGLHLFIRLWGQCCAQLNCILGKWYCLLKDDAKHIPLLFLQSFLSFFFHVHSVAKCLFGIKKKWMLPYCTSYTCGIFNKSHFLALSFKLTFSVLLTSPWGILFQPVSQGSLLTLSCLRLHCVHRGDLWPLCLCLQITSEVHLFSHTKGKRHQQAVRDSSSIQGRELSDEEVVRIAHTPYQEQTCVM